MKTKNHARDFVTIATFNSKADAEMLKSWLVKERVAAHVQDETNLQKYWFMTIPKAGIHVQTPKDAYEKTQNLLASPEAAPLLQKAIRCPSCDSLRVQYPDLTRKNFLPTLLGQLFVLLHITKHKYYCEDCHFSWLGAPEAPTHRKEAPIIHAA